MSTDLRHVSCSFTSPSQYNRVPCWWIHTFTAFLTSSYDKICLLTCSFSFVTTSKSDKPNLGRAMDGPRRWNQEASLPAVVGPPARRLALQRLRNSPACQDNIARRVNGGPNEPEFRTHVAESSEHDFASRRYGPELLSFGGNLWRHTIDLFFFPAPDFA
jgi:hypothetical protein